MEKMQTTIKDLHHDNGELNSEEQVWFPNILRYLQIKGTGDGKRGQLHRAHPVVLENFLPEEDLTALLSYTLEHEADFSPSKVVNKGRDTGVKNSYRRSLAFFNIEQRYKEMFTNHINNVLPEVLHKLGMDPFPSEKTEYHMTASNDGEFFKIHSDNGPSTPALESRMLTYVYYFCREPKAFTGGNLQVYDTIKVDDYSMAALNYQTIIPLRNRIVFFPSHLLHEVVPVHCPSKQFADSRFTFNGWLHQPPKESN